MSRDAFDKWLLASGLSLSYCGIVHDRTQTAFLKFLFSESHYLDILAKASYTNPRNWTASKHPCHWQRQWKLNFKYVNGYKFGAQIYLLTA